MSVTNYTPEKCRYAIDKLVNAVYLVSENAVKDIRIDNGAAYVNSISETPIKLECYGLTLSEEESLDERYKFIHTLKFSVNGYANKDDFQGRYYVIVRDYEGTWWLVNPLFPCKVAYTYTLGYQQNHTEFNIGTASNHPVLKLNGMSDTSSYQCNEYWLSGIDKLWLNEKKYSVHSGSSIKYTNDGFKEVEYNKSSAVFTESFDGENTSHQIDFDVLFSDYKSSWHYNLLEFKDNLYAAIIKTTDGKYALCGFSFGLQPGYTVSADDTVTTGNKIQITLQDAHDAGDAIEMFDNISPIPVSSTTWEYTSEYDGYECVGDGVAKYLLQKEIDALGNETGNYKALEGYENSFPGLNIVGTFDSVVTFAKSECLIEPCRLSTSIPSSILFTEVGSKTYTLRAGSSWTITHDQGITVNPESGNANTDYVVTVYNPHTPTSDAWVTSLKVSYCSGQEYNSVITVKVDDSCLGNGSRYDISANAQTLTIPTNCCVQKITEKTGVGTINSIYSTYLTVYVPENNSGIARTIILLVEFCDGSVANITINQSNTYEEWRDDHEICIGRSKYMLQYKYTGTTPSHCDTKTDETRTVLVEATSDDCIYEYRWVLSDETECDDYDEYYLYQRQVRVIDSLDPWENVVPAEYSIDAWGTEEPVIYKKKSVNCGWVNYAMYRWIDTDDGECFEVMECEDFETLNVPISIRDGVAVDNTYSSVYNVSSSQTGLVQSNVSEILIGKDLTYDLANPDYITFLTYETGLTISNHVTTCSRVSDYQTLVGCGVNCLVACTNTCRPDEYDERKNILSEGFCYLLKDTPIESWTFTNMSKVGVSRRAVVYVPDWSLSLLRSEYKYSTANAENPIILPLTDYPVPLILTNYEYDVTGYTCNGFDKYEIGNVKNESGTVIETSAIGELLEHNSEDCGYGGENMYLTFRTLENTTFTNTYLGSDLSYSLDDGNTWNSLSVDDDYTTPTIESGGTILWKANNIGTARGFSSTGRFVVEGNVMSLVYGDNFSGQTSLSGYNHMFLGMFSGCTGLTSAENMVLPATTLSNDCYKYMFAGCTSLTGTPQLPASTLKEGCYYGIFSGCTSLTTAPVLSASTLAESCYGEMFGGCTSLVTAPSLPATALGRYCYNNMFGGCTSLTVAPPLPATTLSTGCYKGMFTDCTSLTSAPVLSATTLTEECYQYMFNRCTSLNYIKCLATNKSASRCTNYWVNGVASNGTFVKDSNASWSNGVSGIPNNWTIQDA